MLRVARIALALISIFVITLVLVTPDPTDDVPGVLPPLHPNKAHKLAVCHIPLPVWQSALVLLTVPASSTQSLPTSELLDLVCVSRC
jgi:hypothetical protein